MKALSEQLDGLAQHAHQTEQIAAAARDKNRASLAGHRDQLKVTIEEGQTKAKAKAAAGKDDAQAWWNEVRSDLSGRLDAVRSKRDEHRAEHDMQKAERRADDAELEAVDAISFAEWAIEQAAYMFIDAVMARVEAEELAASVTGPSDQPV